MKKINLFLGSMLMFLLFSCSENDGEQIAPAADLSQMNFRSEAKAGQIVLRWDNPDPNKAGYYYMKVAYHDPREKKDFSLTVSSYADSLVIDNTRARYNGQYKFTFTPYSETDTPGTPVTIEAQSGAAEKTLTVSKEALNLQDVSKFYTNAQEPSEGPLSAICDGNVSNYFHTNWQTPDIVQYHYIDVDLGEELTRFELDTWNRTGNAADCPGTVRLYRITKLNDPDVDMNNPLVEYTHPNKSAGGEALYMFPAKEEDELSEPVRFLRYCSISSASGHAYWNMAEFGVNKVTVNVYDPEVDEIPIYDKQ